MDKFNILYSKSQNALNEKCRFLVSIKQKLKKSSKCYPV